VVVAITTAVGHAYLKIMPSLQGLGRHLRDQIRESERTAPAISLTAQVQTALLREQLRVAAREGDQTAIRLLAELDAVPAETQFQALLRRLSGKSVDVKVTTNRAALSQIAGALSQVSSGADKTALGFVRMSASVGAATLKYAVLAASVGQAIGALGALGGAAVTASGSLLLVPAAGIALAVAMNTAKLGMQGFSEALAESDPAKFAEALNKLAPSARDTALAVRALAPAWSQLRLDVQQRLFAGLSKEVRDLGGLYLPVLRTGLGEMAESLNAGARGFGAFARETQTVTDLRTILDNSATSMGSLSQAVQPFLRALRDIAVVGSDFLPGFASSIGESAQRFAAFIAHARETGQLKEWISQGLSALGELFTILGNLVKIVTTVFAAADAGGVSLLSTLTAVTGSVLAFLRSAEGTQVLHQIFGGLRAIVDGLRPVFAQLGPLLVNSIGPAVAQLGPMLGAALGALAPAIAPLGQIIAALAPVLGAVAQGFAAVLVPAVQALAPIVQALAPALAEVAGLLGGAIGDAIRAVAPALQQLAKAAAPLIVQFGQLLAEAFRTIGPLLAQLLTALTPIITQLGGAFLQALSAVLPVLGQLAQVFSQVFLAALQPLLPVLPVIVQVITQLAGVISRALSAAAPILAQVGTLLGQILAQAITSLVPIIPPLAEAFLNVVTALLPLLPPLLELVSTLLPPLTGLIVGLAPVITNIATIFASLVSAVAPFIIQLAQFLIPIIRDLLTVVGEVFKGIGEIIGGAMQAIRGVIDIVMGVISGDWSKAWNGIKEFVSGIFGGILKGAADAIGGLVGFFAGIPGRILGALGDLGSLLLEAGKNIIRGLVDGITAGFRWVRDKLGELTDWITDWKGPPARDKVLLAPNGRLIMQGLLSGLRDEEPAIRDYLTTLTTSLPVTVPPDPGASQALTGAAMGPNTPAVPTGWQADPGLLAEAVTAGVLAALDGARMQVDGAGVARLVNTVNARNARR
jgi:phage-related protein